MSEKKGKGKTRKELVEEDEIVVVSNENVTSPSAQKESDKKKNDDQIQRRNGRCSFETSASR